MMFPCCLSPNISQGQWTSGSWWICFSPWPRRSGDPTIDFFRIEIYRKPWHSLDFIRTFIGLPGGFFLRLVRFFPFNHSETVISLKDLVVTRLDRSSTTLFWCALVVGIGFLPFSYQKYRRLDHVATSQT